MKIRLLIALLSLLAVGAVVYVRASSSSITAPAPATPDSACCADGSCAMPTPAAASESAKPVEPAKN